MGGVSTVVVVLNPHSILARRAPLDGDFWVVLQLIGQNQVTVHLFFHGVNLDETAGRFGGCFCVFTLDDIPGQTCGGSIQLLNDLRFIPADVHIHSDIFRDIAVGQGEDHIVATSVGLERGLSLVVGHCTSFADISGICVIPLGFEGNCNLTVEHTGDISIVVQPFGHGLGDVGVTIALHRLNWLIFCCNYCCNFVQSSLVLVIYRGDDKDKFLGCTCYTLGNGGCQGNLCCGVCGKGNCTSFCINQVVVRYPSDRGAQSASGRQIDGGFFLDGVLIIAVKCRQTS